MADQDEVLDIEADETHLDDVEVVEVDGADADLEVDEADADDTADGADDEADADDAESSDEAAEVTEAAEVIDPVAEFKATLRAETGEWFGKKIAALKKRNKAVVDVRGAGLIRGIELDREAAPVQKRLLEKGFVVGTARKSVIRLLPPYVIPKAALSAFLTALEETLKEGAA